MFATYIHITLHPAPHNNYNILLIYLQQSSFMYKYKKNRNINNYFYYRKMPNVTKKNLIITISIIV